MHFHKFILRVHHDKGYINIHTTAQSAEAAKQIVIAAERCPASSIRSIRAFDRQYFQLVTDDPLRHVVLPLAAPAVKTDNLVPPKGTTRHSARIDSQRWRRIYMGRCGDTVVNYVIVDGLKVVVTLPGSLR